MLSVFRLISLFTFFIVAGSVLSAESTSPKSNDIDDELIAEVSKQCPTENFSVLGFPGLYLNESTFAACEVAFLFDPERYGPAYSLYLNARDQSGRGAPSYFWDDASRFLGDYFGIQQEMSTDLNLRVAQGDPTALFLQLLYNENGASLAPIKHALAKHVGKDIGELFLFDPRSSDASSLSWASIENYTDALISASGSMSSAYVTLGTISLRQMIIGKSDPEMTPAQVILNMPVSMREKILILTKLTNVFTRAEEGLLLSITASSFEKHSFVLSARHGSFRPKADIRNNHYCCDAASLQRTLIDRAAFAPPEEIWVILFADTARLNS